MLSVQTIPEQEKNEGASPYRPSHKAQLAWIEYMLRDLGSCEISQDEFSSYLAEIEADLGLGQRDAEIEAHPLPSA